VFERFDDTSRRIVVLAQEETRLLSHDWIGTEHLLLALLREPGMTPEVLAGAGLVLDAVRDEVGGIIGRGPSPPTGHIPFTPQAKGTLEGALRHALRLGHKRIMPGHILLGLLDNLDGVAGQVLERQGPTLVPQLQNEVERRLVAGVEEGDGAEGVAGAGGGLGDRVRRLIRREESVQAVGQVRAVAVSPAVTQATTRAGDLAGERGRYTTLELLAGVITDRASAAARVLEAAGVDLDDLERRLATATVEHTSDETPEQAGARHIAIDAEGDEAVIRVSDPALVDRIKRTLERGEVGGLDQLWRVLQSLTEPVSWREVSFPIGKDEGEEGGEPDDEPPIDPEVP
jgi:ATP-dependent Clp protease ATP-binding subunit ClpC